MKWVTRSHLHIDRTACAWLIRRAVDPEAEFIFVEELDDIPPDATPFDVLGAELSHHGGDCSFETILRRYELTDPVLWELAKVVHEADLADERYDAPAAVGLDVLIRGLTLTSESNHNTLAITDQLFDGLYEHTRRGLITGRPPA